MLLAQCKSFVYTHFNIIKYKRHGSILTLPDKDPTDQPLHSDAVAHPKGLSIGLEGELTRRVSITFRPPDYHTAFTKAGIIALLAVIGLLLLSLSGLIVTSLPQLNQSTSHGSSPGGSFNRPRGSTCRSCVNSSSPTATDDSDQDVTPTPNLPIYLPGNKPVPALSLPQGSYILYEQQGNLYLVSSNGGQATLLTTPGYEYNPSVHPLLTPSGQLLYSGDGVWLMDIFNQTATRIASVASDQIITSMALSNDGTAVAWSTEPVDGRGNVAIYAGPLAAPILVYQQSADNCPCFRIFSFMGDSKTLLLSDDQASHEAVQYGLWSLDLTNSGGLPQPLLNEDSLQGPLALAPSGNTLLYAPDEGVVPNPTDGSVPADIAALTYADSIDIATLTGSPMAISTSQIVLPEQRDLNNAAAYHWVTTPLFTPDAHTLVYVEFSSDSQAPFDRHSALFTVQFTGSGKHLHVGRPRLLFTSTSLLVELGVWLSDHVLTFYADGTLYALDIHSSAVTTVLSVGSYARIVGVVGTP
jgi:hypothetical protein